MNFDEFYDSISEDEAHDMEIGEGMRMSWDECKDQILKILENEIDNRDCSIVKATRKIRKEI